MPGRGRGKGRGRVKEGAEQEAARLAKEEVERKKYRLIKLIRDYPVLYDTAHPEHLNKAVTSVIWAEIATMLDETGTYLILIPCKSV